MTKILLFITTLFCFAFVEAQTYFGPQQNIIEGNTATNPIIIRSADLDGDGDKDLVIASRYDNQLIWQENLDGNGTFGPHNVLSTNLDQAFGLDVGDIDGDDDIDIVALDNSQQKLYWYENTDGLGTFADQALITDQLTYPYGLKVADLDGDNDMDLVLTESYGHRVIWLENTDGAGTFSSAIEISSDVNMPYGVEAADLDGDDDLDVISCSLYDYKVAWYENTDGEGTFGSQQIITTNLQYVRYAVAADINGDTYPDIIAASLYNASARLVYFLNTDGEGTFGTEQLLTSEVNNARNFQLFDIDGDNDNDIFVVDDEEHEIMWFENDGSGNFGSKQLLSESFENPNYIIIDTIDNDTLFDVAVVSGGDNKTAWFKHADGEDSFSEPNYFGQSIDYPQAVYSADLDGDGDFDVLTASSSDDKVAWFENLDGNGQFGDLEVINYEARYAECVAAADFNGDSLMDVVAGSRDDKTLSWYQNIDGEKQFGEEQVISNTFAAYKIFPVDVDGDDDIDICAGSEISDSIVWFANDGNGNFGVAQLIDNEIGDVLAIHAADLDQDNDIDLIASIDNGAKIVWYENTDGAGNFGDSITLGYEYDDVMSIVATDFDGDYDLDILYVEGFGDLAWIQNDGGGEFVNTHVITNGLFYSKRTRACDFDQDGDMDVVYLNYFSDYFDNNVCWYENTDGMGNFSEKKLISLEADGAEDLFVADLDGDTDLEILTVSNEESKVSWYENFTLGILTQPSNMEVCIGSPVEFFIDVKDADEIQWQVNMGSGFENLSNDSNYEGVDSTILFIAEFSSEMLTYSYRCAISNTQGTIFSSQVIAISETESPEIISIHNDQSIAANINCEAVLPDYTTEVEATDNCDAELEIVQSPIAGTIISGLVNEITIEVFDDGGNSSQVIFNLAVVDNDSPIAVVETLPELTDECSVIVSESPTATDNCAGTISATTTDPLEYTAQGTYIITWTYDDGNGNTATQEQTVIVDDVTAPVPDEATLPALTGECSVTVTDTPTATDNCAGTITATTSDPLEYTEQGTYTITWTYDDGNGNTTMQEQTVTVEDATAPVVSCIENQVIDLNEGETEYVVSGTAFDPAEVADNCEIATVTNDFNDAASLAGAAFPIATTEVTWTVTDMAGNTQTCSFEVIVNEYVGLVGVAAGRVKIFPNPTNGTFTVELGVVNEPVLITIVDMQGKTIHAQQTNQTKNALTLQNVSNGIYQVIIQNKNNRFVQKLVKL